MRDDRGGKDRRAQRRLGGNVGLRCAVAHRDADQHPADFPHRPADEQPVADQPPDLAGAVEHEVHRFPLAQPLSEQAAGEWLAARRMTLH